MEKKDRVAIIWIMAAISIVSFVVGTSVRMELKCDNQNTDFISITSVEDGQQVHSKVVVDAHVTGNVSSITVTINGTRVSNYVPFTWNNIGARAGNYSITVTATIWNESSEVNISKTVTVEIPEEETFIGDRNNFTEPHVIHEGQSVVWMDGIINLSRVEMVNGGNPYNLVYEVVDVYGNLTVINCTIVGFSSIYARASSTLTFQDCTIYGPVQACETSSTIIRESHVNAVSGFGNSRVELIGSTYNSLGTEDNATIVR